MEPVLLIAIAWSVLGSSSFLVETATFRGRGYESDRAKRIGALQLGGPIAFVLVAWRALESRWR